MGIRPSPFKRCINVSGKKVREIPLNTQLRIATSHKLMSRPPDSRVAYLDWTLTNAIVGVVYYSKCLLTLNCKYLIIQFPHELFRDADFGTSARLLVAQFTINKVMTY